MGDVISVNTLNCVYFGLFLLGVGYAIFILISGGLSDIDMPNVDVDIPQINLPGDVDIPGADIHLGGPEVAAGGLDMPDVSVSPLSPITIASFVTAFGGIGVITSQFFKIDPRWSLVWATGGALVLSGLMFLFYSQFLIRSQGSSEVRASELIGLPAEVSVPIGEGVTGQVAYATKAGRMLSMAKAVDGREIPRGQLVKIVRVVGPIVLVRPVSMEEASEEES
ncbi:MAG: NfeD family protein [Anaerolineae bacterium]|nr:NfeD family protein [Anaerolineae bacterium]